MAVLKSFKIVSNVNDVEKELERKLHSWLEGVALDASSTAKTFTPVDTGRLKNSISYVVDDSEHSAIIGTNVEYAPYQEFGTSRGITGKHFLQFGVQAHLEEYKSTLERVLKSS